MSETFCKIVDEYELKRELIKNGLNELLADFVFKYINGGKNSVKRMFTNNLHFEVFKHLPNKPNEIHFSNNYLVFVYVFRIGREVGYGLYIFGINSDKKIFINKLRQHNIPSYNKVCELMVYENGTTTKRIPIYKNTDEEFYQVLGYQIDLESSEIKVIPIYKDNETPAEAFPFYRIQGDLVLELFEPEEYYQGIATIVRANIRRILINTILQRIMSVLEDIGISSEIVVDELVFRGLSRQMRTAEIDHILNCLSEYIVDNVDLSDIGAEFEIDRLWDISEDKPKVGLRVREGRGEFGVRYKPIEIEIQPNMTLQLKYVNEVMQNLRLEKEWRIMRIGRHLVRYYGYPNRFTIVTKIINNDEYVIPIEIPTIYISKGELYVYHPEHKQIAIKVEKDIAARFRSVEVDDEFDDRLNYYALRQLQQFSELKKFYKLA